MAPDAQESEDTVNTTANIMTRAAKYLLWAKGSFDNITPQQQVTAPLTEINFENLHMQEPSYHSEMLSKFNDQIQHTIANMPQPGPRRSEHQANAPKRASMAQLWRYPGL